MVQRWHILVQEECDGLTAVPLQPLLSVHDLLTLYCSVVFLVVLLVSVSCFPASSHWLQTGDALLGELITLPFNVINNEIAVTAMQGTPRDV